MARHLSQQLFSGGWSSHSLVGAKAAIVRGFWCRVNTELIIHGATDPRATVRVQGRPVALRKDGTFSLRTALPEGTQTIAIEAVSPDGKETRTTTPVVGLSWTGPVGVGTIEVAPQHPFQLSTEASSITKSGS